MTSRDLWALPAGIEEVLPPDAYELEMLCRKLIDLFHSWGYQFTIPPLAEYLDSLLTGTGEDLDLKTFKITDQLTGRLMGIRADMTPQVARIDSHKLGRDTPARLCYLGTVLHTRPAGHGDTRAPLQIGAELFGHSGIESDAEILSLMMTALHTAGLRDIHVDIGHVGIVRILVDKLDISVAEQSGIFSALQKKSANELDEILARNTVSRELSAALLSLVDLYGGMEVLIEARNIFEEIDRGVVSCISELQQIAELTAERISDAPLYFDLADLRGYKYHNGMMFAVYVRGQGQGIAFGGRYDGIGREFGRSRPATGFSIDARRLYDMVSRPSFRPAAIFAPDSRDVELYKVISELRNKGETVICSLPGQTGDGRAMDCDRELHLEDGIWKIRGL